MTLIKKSPNVLDLDQIIDLEKVDGLNIESWSVVKKYMTNGIDYGWIDYTPSLLTKHCSPKDFQKHWKLFAKEFKKKTGLCVRLIYCYGAKRNRQIGEYFLTAENIIAYTSAGKKAKENGLLLHRPYEKIKEVTKDFTICAQPMFHDDW